ncbi:FxSxx-COOH system tetratricopeptide repeat protein [Plantactinospora sp. KLBMP9567]|uniref:FxSxx-COOH system tetratricopeptide repeat protein n=1 Tax=Plantactinospora sp. KLBMP9567 TaxID=3085900 RepID=UPI00298141D0|nr:FxSxx-COOH system tetratricopeptide repeat protein [Plantactinospora sp. KLBMP9567]MDW5326822.1 FxSxx-COOH system tetratricopeptide repeat protein [Plantactinospora sp. KLBMP9567]
MSTRRVNALVTLLLQIPGLKDPNTRPLYRQELEAALQTELAIRDTNSPRMDLHSLVRRCEAEPYGLQTLFDVVEILNEGTTATQDLKRLLQEWAHEDELIEILQGTPTEEIQYAIKAVTGTTVNNQRIHALVQEIGWQVNETWAAPAILAVVEVLFHNRDDRSGIDQWLDRAAPHLGWGKTDLSRLRGAAGEILKIPQPEPPDSQVDTSHDSPEPKMKIIIKEETTKEVSSTRIRGGIPARSPYFTGRDTILRKLEQTLHDKQQAAVLPEAILVGQGGVGKTQIAVEFAYQHAERYELIWWMPAEDLGSVRASLAHLATRLELPSTGSLDQTIRSVLDVLASTTTLRWLLVYDNADDPEQLESLVPSSGGHVLVTSRNPDWAATGPICEVDVFTRDESMAMLRKRQPELSEADASRLADVLGDLPLALEQAVISLITGLTSVDEYLDQFRRRAQSLLREGKPRQYPHTVLTLVALAVARLREEAPVAAQLVELVAFLSPEPISVTVLWQGRGADLTEPLRGALQEHNHIARAVRDLARSGLVNVDNANRRLSMHRLFQQVLREELVDERREQGLLNARRLVAAANPGDPDDLATWQRHAELRTHVRAAGLVDGGLHERRTVVDQLRYVYNTGDFEQCRDLAETIIAVWERPVAAGGHGPDDPLTLLAVRRYADALRMLTDPRAAKFARRAYDGMLQTLGEEHEYTLGAMNSVGADLRIAGNFAEARQLDERNLEIHRRVFTDGDPSTLRALNSVAVNRRWAGDFAGAYEIDTEAERLSRAALGESDAARFLAVEGQARDLMGLGRYTEALNLQQEVLSQQERLLGKDHALVLRATNLIAGTLRRSGKIRAALRVAHDNYRDHTIRFLEKHGQTVMSTATYANCLRAAGDPTLALKYMTTALTGYRDLYGEEHPMTLATALNLGIIQRTLGYDREALRLDERTYSALRRVLGEHHPFTLAAMVNYSNDLSRTHQLDQARAISSAAWEHSIRVRGPRHPYTLYAAVNAALDLIQTEEEERGESLRAEAIDGLRQAYIPEHPDIQAAQHYRRLECELEPPPI